MQEEGSRVLKPKTFWQQLLATHPNFKVLVQNLFMLKKYQARQQGEEVVFKLHFKYTQMQPIQEVVSSSLHKTSLIIDHKRVKYKFRLYQIRLPYIEINSSISYYNILISLGMTGTAPTSS